MAYPNGASVAKQRTEQLDLFDAGPAIGEAEDNELIFSTGRLSEVVIKRDMGREDFEVDSQLLRCVLARRRL
jgi:hypothetical protein